MPERTTRPRPVVVWEPDTSIRVVLTMTLQMEGYHPVLAPTQIGDLLDLLLDRRLRRGFLLLSNGSYDHRDIVTICDLLLAHRRLRQLPCALLSTAPHRLPPHLQTQLLQLRAPVLAKPFDLDALLRVVAAAFTPAPAREGVLVG